MISIVLIEWSWNMISKQRSMKSEVRKFAPLSNLRDSQKSYHTGAVFFIEEY